MNEEEFKKKLTPEQYRIMRQKGAEQPFTGKYWDSEEEGTYACAACGNELFSSEDKFDSETGFPSFKKSLDAKKIELVTEPDSSDRLDVRCKSCASHLGYVIDGDDKYYRMNSSSLELKENGEDEEDEEEEQDSNKKTEKFNGGKLLIKNMVILTATAAISLAIGATAGVAICKNSTPAPAPSLAPIVSSPASNPKPAPTSTLLPRSTSYTPPAGGAATTPPPPPPLEPTSVTPAEPPTTSSSDRITPAP